MNGLTDKTPLSYFSLHYSFDTFEGEKETITMHYRDSMKQERITVDELEKFVRKYFQ